MTRVVDREGKAQEVQINLEDYAQAFAEGKSFAQHLNTKFKTDTTKFGSAFDQVLASSGIFVRENKTTGAKPPSLAELFATGGNAEINMGTMTRNEGNARDTTLGRLLFPSIVLEMMDAYLLDNTESFEGQFQQMVAKTTAVDSPRWTQPLIDVTAPRSERSNPISQNSEPRSMVNISLSEKSYKVPTFSIGLSITDEAMKATSLDLVGIALREQATGERIKVIEEGLQKMILGDADLGISALTGAVAGSTYDAAATGGVMTQKAFLFWLRSNWKKQAITHVICDLATYWAVENRSGRKTTITDLGQDTRLDSGVSIVNSNIVEGVKFFVVDDPALIGGTNRLIGLDAKRAINKVICTSSSYSAVENFVLRKSSAYRFDWSESYMRLLNGNDAWQIMTF